LIYLGILGFIAFILLFAEFFHTETSLVESDDCPICLWERNTIAIDKIFFLIVSIVFILLHQLNITDLEIPFFLIFYHFKNRAPPFV
ncbi:MAG: hypothetical protein KAT17_05060, partial [Candidatus Aminicenantes bacterium]|nr:hypothetical protein [Candidatus Aminicenantes bacterium]